MHTLTTSMQYSIESPSYNNQTEKRIKNYPNWKGRDETVTNADDMILYIESPKTIRNDTWIKIEGSKVNIQKSVTFLYTNNIEKLWKKNRF